MNSVSVTVSGVQCLVKEQKDVVLLGGKQVCISRIAFAVEQVAKEDLIAFCLQNNTWAVHYNAKDTMMRENPPFAEFPTVEEALRYCIVVNNLRRSNE